LRLVEYIHERGVLHRDIKPANLLVGLGTHGNQIYMIDFGIAKMYRNPTTLQHNQELARDFTSHTTGTTLFASARANLGQEQSRRDDLEAIGYVLMYLLRGSLPWKTKPDHNNLKQAAKEMWRLKTDNTYETRHKRYPEEFAVYLRYCQHLRFDETPDCSYLRKLFKDLFVRIQYDSNIFDWNAPCRD
ncbi:kinase-like domain-containing protein, partial [Pavlovales sp. CCMP2436]